MYPETSGEFRSCCTCRSFLDGLQFSCEDLAHFVSYSLRPISGTDDLDVECPIDDCARFFHFRAGRTEFEVLAYFFGSTRASVLFKAIYRGPRDNLEGRLPVWRRVERDWQHWGALNPVPRRFC